MNTYLISFTSYFLLQEKLQKILQNNPYSVYDLNMDSLEDVLEEALYFSLFDEKKYIIVRNAMIFGSTRKKKDEKEEKNTKKADRLLQYINEPNPNTVLIFTMNGKIDNKKKIVSALKTKGTIIEEEILKPQDIKNRMVSFMKKDGYKIDLNSINYIMNNCLNNYDLIINELEKIKLYYKKGCGVSFEDVKEITSHLIEENNFKFLDAVLNKNVKEALTIYEDLKIQKVEPLMLLIMLSKELRQVLLVKQLGQKNKKEIMEFLDIKYDFQLEKYKNISLSYKEKELIDYLLYLCELDYKIKSGKLDKKLAILLFILYMNK